jgi:hypothetical protein
MIILLRSFQDAGVVISEKEKNPSSQNPDTGLITRSIDFPVQLITTLIWLPKFSIPKLYNTVPKTVSKY